LMGFVSKYPSVGKGKPIVLCHRFRGVLDLWDPAFIGSLAAEGFLVVTFDYSGLCRPERRAITPRP
jgi:pimeloyl-ACP methyl ester carboxylesterase